MSLAVLADHMASKGRGPDSMLIHMSPSELQGLQALAMSHGGSLTINPETGLPEAGFLDKLLPAIIGFALNAVAPGAGEAVAGLWGGAGGAAAGTAAIVGGVQTARTGSLAEGVQAGLGAYGGANLASGMASAGASQLAGEALLPAAAEQAALEGITLPSNYADIAARSVTPAQIAAAKEAALASGSNLDVVSKGFDAASKNPMQFAKDNWRSLAGVAVPAILAGENVKSGMPQTVTKPGMIRPYSYDPYGGGFVAGNPYEAQVKQAATGGIMGFDESSNSPMSRSSLRNMQDVGGMFNFAHDGGGVMKMAEGGIAGYADGGYTQDQINAALQAELAARSGTSQADLTSYAKSKYGLSDAQINAAYDTLPGFNAQGKYDQADYIATHVPGQVDPQMVVNAAQAANPYSAQNMAKVDTTRQGHYVQDPATGQYVALTNYSPGFDINNPTALTYLGQGLEQAKAGLKSSAADWFSQNATAEQKAKATDLWAAEKSRLEAIDRAAGRLPALNADANKGLAGLNQNQNLLTNQKPLADQNQNAGLAALANLPAGASDVDKWFVERGLGLTPVDTSINKFLATYKNELASMTPKNQEDTMRAALATEKMNEADVIRATGMTIAQLAAAKRKDGSLIVAGDLDKVPAGSLPGGVSGAGNTVVNPNGTITTRPDIPGIPEGGFTGMTDVKNAYTQGGGSLGYTSPVPKSYADFENTYNKLTGGSKAAYDYLTGKTPYSATPWTPTGEVQKPYAESVLGMPANKSAKMYLFDPTTKQYKINPDYAIPTYDKDGKKSYNLTNADVKAYMDKSPSTDAFYTWATTNNLSPEQIAAASGRPITEVNKLFTGAKDLVGDDGKIDTTKVDAATAKNIETNWDEAAYLAAHPDVANELKTGKSVSGQPVQFSSGYEHWLKYGKDAKWEPTTKKAEGGLAALTMAGGGMADHYNLGGYSDGGRLLRGPGDGVSDSIPATIGGKRPARLADGEFVVPARIVSELGNGSTEAGARKLYAMMDRVQAARKGSIGKGRVATNSRADKYLPA